MYRFITQLGMVSLLVSLMAVSAVAGKPKTFSKSDLPPAVLVSFESTYPKAKSLKISQETKDSVLYYEIECKDAGSEKSLLYTIHGTVHELDEAISTKSIPDSVYYAVRVNAPHGKIDKVERVTRGTVVEYEVLVKEEDKQTEYIFNGSGKVLSSEVDSTNSTDESEETETDDDNE